MFILAVLLDVPISQEMTVNTRMTINSIAEGRRDEVIFLWNDISYVYVYYILGKPVVCVSCT